MIVAAVLVTAVVVTVGQRVGLSTAASVALATAIALVLVQVLAHGMTLPLREMVTAARAMAHGDYRRRVTATSRDEVGELARAFNSMAAELAEVDRVRRDLVANVSHELRTPISALQALLENLVDGVEPVEPETLESTLRQVKRLGGLVEQLLDLSRLESGAVPLEWSPMPARELLEEVADEWRPKAAERDISLLVDVEPDDLQVTVDAHRMHQVVTNLVANAVRHSPVGGRIVLRAQRGRGRSVFEVVDDGPGIAPEEVERVFERFYRSDRSRAASEGGSGLGLSIARWIVELHGGSIRAENAVPSGCRIVVELG